jgi:DNA primase
MAFSPAFLDELRSRLALSDLVGRRVKLVKRGREHTGLCPFHSEKTPSFTVSDPKGFYHCFGCGAHGDVIKFAMETEGLSFPEAVERLAGEAGLEVPRETPQERERAERAATLYDVLEAAAAWFEERLRAEEGQEARGYLERRGLAKQAWTRFRIGFAPDQRGLLKKAMNAKGIDDEKLIAAGLLKRAEDGSLRDYFFNRVMIPITDRRGRIIAFGGRALGESPAKYLNSPDTDLFHKGRLLYNLANARQALSARTGAAEARLVVVEGYMDVIAMAEFGFAAAVAPLGTAVTEEQIQELWKLSDEPTLCLDGDSAGLRAALRAAERALPLLRPGRSLRFCFLPQGEDPDSLLRAKGAQALADVLAAGESLFDAIWRVKAAAFDFSRPDQRAKFVAEIKESFREIRDEDVRSAYLDAVFNRLRERPKTAPGGARRGTRGSYGRKEYEPPKHQDITGPLLADIAAQRRSYRSSVTHNLSRRQEELLLATLINHPDLLDELAEKLALVALNSSDLKQLRTALLDAFAADPGLDREALGCHLNDLGYQGLLERLLSRELYTHGAFAKPDADLGYARAGWLEVFALAQKHQSEAETDDARRRLAEEMTDENLARLAMADGAKGS